MRNRFVRISFSLALLIAAFLAANAGSATNVDNEATDYSSHRYKYLEMLKEADLKQMLHEKGEAFHHLRSKRELILAVLKLEKREEALRKARVTDTVQHEVRVEYCSG
ncbi:hypothetical protein, conserved [Trypanosoma brucei gambiense DAL972]|uniref:T. brucei spp.-specific protein n=1 Tax=Trypanosoma brucei gambiense (strain MHOM/CI/86/DAL972) TaxID=679716 RepID=C9ZNK8_TRYB9|nr:hypothetical protein, conserved [Trypanosoma brucei gambiense DAL972]CBH10986.1 hypothetical protein, conserved [Trypanosoma brucei gambiense DAL972]|eukprot:XP_011773273.1 hypothetical protein, conserved [Trypanosoma brucei gambiense DAL972]